MSYAAAYGLRDPAVVCSMAPLTRCFCPVSDAVLDAIRAGKVDALTAGEVRRGRAWLVAMGHELPVPVGR